MVIWILNYHGAEHLKSVVPRTPAPGTTSTPPKIQFNNILWLENILFLKFKITLIIKGSAPQTKKSSTGLK